MKNELKISSIRLVLMFSEEIEIPLRFKADNKPKKKKAKIKIDTGIEQKFNAKVDTWERVLGTMMQKIEVPQALRFINLNPKVEPSTKSVSMCPDFLAFNTYLLTRRDIEQCDDDETGNLALLLTAFQREVEAKIK